MKGQVSVYFLPNYCVDNNDNFEQNYIDKNLWMLYFNGLCRVRVNRIDMFIVSPYGFLTKFMIRLSKWCLNNETDFNRWP